MILNTISLGLLAVIPVASGMNLIKERSVIAELAPPPPVVGNPKTWTCPDCTPEEKFVLKNLQSGTKIPETNALATITGQMKQQKTITTTICYRSN